MTSQASLQSPVSTTRTLPGFPRADHVAQRGKRLLAVEIWLCIHLDWDGSFIHCAPSFAPQIQSHSPHHGTLFLQLHPLSLPSGRARGIIILLGFPLVGTKDTINGSRRHRFQLGADLGAASWYAAKWHSRGQADGLRISIDPRQLIWKAPSAVSYMSQQQGIGKLTIRVPCPPASTITTGSS